MFAIELNDLSKINIEQLYRRGGRLIHHTEQKPGYWMAVNESRLRLQRERGRCLPAIELSSIPEQCELGWLERHLYQDSLHNLPSHYPVHIKATQAGICLYVCWQPCFFIRNWFDVSQGKAPCIGFISVPIGLEPLVKETLRKFSATAYAATRMNFGLLKRKQGFTPFVSSIFYDVSIKLYPFPVVSRDMDSDDENPDDDWGMQIINLANLMDEKHIPDFLDRTINGGDFIPHIKNKWRELYERK